MDLGVLEYNNFFNKIKAKDNLITTLKKIVLDLITKEARRILNEEILKEEVIQCLLIVKEYIPKAGKPKY